MCDRQLINDMVALLQGQMSSVSSRRALVESALFGCGVLEQIEWTGAAQPFTHHLVTTVCRYGDCEPGTPAIVTLLEAARDQRGSNWHPSHNELIARVQQSTNQDQSQGEQPMDKSQLIAFLVTTGIWAQTQLGEIWTLRRQKEAEKPSIELEDEPTMQSEAPAELADAQVDRAAQLLEKMHKNISDWLDEKEEVDRLINLGTMDEIRGTRRKKDLDDKINAKLEEIPTAMARLGVKIDRE
jgi:hypothetical protein